MLSLSVVLGIVALVCAIVAGILNRGSTTFILLSVAVAVLAVIHVAGGVAP